MTPTKSEWCADPRPLRADVWRNSGAGSDVGMYSFLNSCSLGGLLTGVPDGVGIDGLIAAMVLRLPGNSHTLGFRRNRCQWARSSSSSLGLELLSRSTASLPPLNVNHHALAVHVTDFQGALNSRVPDAGGVKRHEQNALVGCASGIDELRNFFLTQDRRGMRCAFFG